MSLQPGIFENEEGERNLPFGDDQNTPFYATSKGDRSDGFGDDSGKEPTVQIWSSTLSPEAVRDSRVLMGREAAHYVSWNAENLNGVVIMNATWRGYKDDRGTIGNIKFANNSYATPAVPASLVPKLGIKRAAATQLVFEQDKPTIILPVNDTDVTPYQKKEMYLVLGWEKRQDNVVIETGYTKSGLFTVYNGEANDNDKEYLEVRKYIMEKVDGNSTETDGQDINSTSPWFPPSTDAVGRFNPSTTSATTANPSATSTSGRDDASNTSSSSGSGGGGGLAPGAIAGIVIGAVFGVAIIAFLIWFLLRRRRRADHAQNGGYGPGGPHEYLADKETHARVVESPHSPYSDDGQTQQHQSSQRHLNDIGQEPVAAAAIPASSANNSPTEHHHRPPFAPYNEQEHTSVASRSLDNVNSNLEGARSSTPNVNSNVSHLIEDGMTEDEIRRLEEEERALDAAIEQAGQGGQRR